jgi:glutamyl-tRNA synthetase
MKQLVEKHVLKNAIDFQCANPKAVLGKVLGENPQLRKDVSAVAKVIAEIIKKVSKLTKEEQKAKLKKISPELLVKKKVKKEKKLELNGAEKRNVVMRFAPSPSGPLHLGHAYVLSLNSELARKYNGTLLLRLEDTNPENIYDKAYELITEDAEWMTKGNIAQVIIQSDRLKYYYDHAHALVQAGYAYVCICNNDKYKRLLTTGKACPCRGKSTTEHHKRFMKMFTIYKPGEAVLRLKTDLTHKNPAMRDFALMRINEHEHPRQGTKHRVWPLMNFSVAVDDHLLKVTHTLRAKDHRDNEKRQAWIYRYFKWRMPQALYVGRINFTDLQLSSSETRRLILAKKYSNWDDIRLPFMPALKRRGYQPEAFISYAVDVGITENDKKVSKQEFFKTINHSNKNIIDSKANRYFFVYDPVKIKVQNAPGKDVQIKLHPDYNRGHRTFKTKQSFIITKKDYTKLEAKKLHRLMDCINIVKRGNKFLFDSDDYQVYKNHKQRGMIIHWLPATEKMADITVMMEDGTTVKGKGEHRLAELKEGALVQFERFGFCRLDKKNKNRLDFWFAHR